LINSDPLSESIPSKSNGNRLCMSFNASNTHICALFFTACISVHPVQTSVTSRVCMNSPRASPPSCPTRSISTNPGDFSSHSETRLSVLSPQSICYQGLKCKPSGSIEDAKFMEQLFLQQRKFFKFSFSSIISVNHKYLSDSLKSSNKRGDAHLKLVLFCQIL
jgi:hypothetical protein